MVGASAGILNLLFAKTVGSNSGTGLPAQSAENRARCDLLKSRTKLPIGLETLIFGDEFNQRLENTTLPDGLRKEFDIRHRFQSEAGQDESPERAGDLEFGSQPVVMLTVLKPTGNLQHCRGGRITAELITAELMSRHSGRLIVRIVA